MNDDLVAWLREQIAADRAVLGCPGAEPLAWALTEAHTAILDAYEKQARVVDDRNAYDLGEHHAYATAVCCVALAYQHRPGYREEWRP